MATAQQQNSGIVKKLYKSRKYVLELMKAQGYNVSEYNEFSINEIHIMNQSKQLDMLVQNESGQKTYIKYYINSSIRPQNIHDMIDDLYHLEQLIGSKDALLIIAKDPPNDTLINILQQLFADDQIYITIISLSQLQFNILEHDLVPKHTKMTPEEVVEFKKKYNIINDKQIPQISRFDPVAQAIGLRPGECCHIQRMSKTAIDGDYYRICVNN